MPDQAQQGELVKPNLWGVCESGHRVKTPHSGRQVAIRPSRRPEQNHRDGCPGVALQPRVELQHQLARPSSSWTAGPGASRPPQYQGPVPRINLSHNLSICIRLLLFLRKTRSHIPAVAPARESSKNGKALSLHTLRDSDPGATRHRHETRKGKAFSRWRCCSVSKTRYFC